MEKLKFSALSKSALDEREMNALSGGRTCGCGCLGPSSTSANGCANFEGGTGGLHTDIPRELWKMEIRD